MGLVVEGLKNEAGIWWGSRVVKVKESLGLVESPGMKGLGNLFMVKGKGVQGFLQIFPKFNAFRFCYLCVVVYIGYIPARAPSFYFSSLPGPLWGPISKFNQSQPIYTVQSNGSPQGQ